MAKLNGRLEPGIFVGIRKMSNEVMVSTPKGITCARSVKRIPLGNMWGDDCVNWVSCAP